MNTEARAPEHEQQKPRPRAKLTQAERLLQWARAGRVLDQGDWFAGGPDGGAPVTALRSRVADLERRGYRFRHVLRPRQLAQYWLVGEPDAQPQQAPPARVADGREDDAGQLALAPPSGMSVDPVPHWMDL